MIQIKSPIAGYTLGYSEAEIERLKKQSQLFIGPFTQRCLHEAGLPEPELRCEASISASPDWIGYEQLAGVVRSLLPLIVKTGLATAEEVEIDNLADRLRAEVAGRGGIGRGPDVISAWVHKP